uniref:Uncharacterized protein n=1 Tax=Grammatophora oceanica TaxID=210454 RepID=A0A7S1UR26_9STRA|mmetsp:Transcript_18538/g.27537  ORF Transcript_18538/g.27537 Transcript_18538/m.27537 type:complete len:233 (+) Transcript_18538:116-814(+)
MNSSEEDEEIVARPRETSSHDLAAWREAHIHLQQAVLVAREGLSVARAQRRYWLQEIAANIAVSGKLVPSSSWRKSHSFSKKPTNKRKTPPSTKPTKLPLPTNNAVQKTEDDTETEDEDENQKNPRASKPSSMPPKKKLKLKLTKRKSLKSKPSPPEQPADSQDSHHSPDDDPDNPEDSMGWPNHEYSITPAQSYSQPSTAPPGYDMAGALLGEFLDSTAPDQQHDDDNDSD